MNNWGIRARVLVAIIAPLMTSVLLLSGHFIYARIHSVHTDLTERGRAIANQLAPACEYGLFSGNRAILSRLARAALNEPDVIRVAIIDHQGTLLTAATRHGADPQARVDETDTTSSYTFSAPVRYSEIAVDDYAQTPADQATPRAGLTRTLGQVSVTLSTQRAERREHRILVEGLSISGVALSLARSVTMPVRDIMNSVESIKNGDLGTRLNIASGGELHRLGLGINAMVEALQARRESERQQAQDALYMEKARAQITLESLGEGVISTDADGVITYMNQAAESLTGWNRQRAKGLHLSAVFRVHDRLSTRPVDYPIHECIQRGHTIRNDNKLSLVRREGGTFPIRDAASPIRDRDSKVTGAVLVFHDFTEMQRMADRLEYLATHDDLTGLMNRREFESQLADALARSRDTGQQHALCYLDLDQFKIVNDTCGHGAGDELLKQLAEVFKTKIRRNDVLARLGGDEFGVILTDCPTGNALEIAESIREAVREFRFSWRSHVFEVGASIGLVPIFPGETTLSETLRAADAACYIAKEKGRNRIHVYQPDDTDLAQRHGEMQWLHRLKEALSTDRFTLHAQPIVDVAHPGGVPSHYEILLRMTRPDGSLISPNTFLPAAERYQLMPEIDRWVVHNTLTRIRDMEVCRERGMPQLKININLSGQSICEEQFLAYVADEFAATGVHPELITFEITETAAIANLTRAVHFINRLRHMGCEFALDDFGSGLSSFAYLNSLPVDYIKIDGSFVRNVRGNTLHQAIVTSVNTIAHAMGLKTIAEFVEDEQTLAHLRECGVDYAQGFHIALPRPLPHVLREICTGEVGKID